MDKHVAFLQTVCRAGGEKLRGRHYPAIDFKDELKVCFGIDIAKDNPEVNMSQDSSASPARSRKISSVTQVSGLHHQQLGHCLPLKRT